MPAVEGQIEAFLIYLFGHACCVCPHAKPMPTGFAQSHSPEAMLGTALSAKAYQLRRLEAEGMLTGRGEPHWPLCSSFGAYPEPLPSAASGATLAGYRYHTKQKTLQRPVGIEVWEHQQTALLKAVRGWPSMVTCSEEAQARSSDAYGY